MVLKVFAYGFENYWRDGQNRFDFSITWIIGNCFVEQSQTLIFYMFSCEISKKNANILCKYYDDCTTSSSTIMTCHMFNSYLLSELKEANKR